MITSNEMLIWEIRKFFELYELIELKAHHMKMYNFRAFTLKLKQSTSFSLGHIQTRLYYISKHKQRS